MSKKARAAAKDRRLKEKRARKAAQRARYASYCDSGTNSKRKGRQNAKTGNSELRMHRQSNRNRRKTYDVTITLADGSTRTVRRGGTIPFRVFARRFKNAS